MPRTPRFAAMMRNVSCQVIHPQLAAAPTPRIAMPEAMKDIEGLSEAERQKEVERLTELLERPVKANLAVSAATTISQAPSSPRAPP